MFTKVLIANRGAIACRIIRTLGGWAFVRSRCIPMPIALACTCQLADEAVHSDLRRRRELLRQDRIIAAARRTARRRFIRATDF